MIACNDPEHEAQRAGSARFVGPTLDEEAAFGKAWADEVRRNAGLPPSDREVTPCLVCGAPILDNIGHDDGCMVAPAPIADYIAEIRRDIEAAGL